MKELKDIVSAYDIAVAAGRQSALATVVHLEGSSYRRPGARMLITDDGQLTGAISGGCLEGDALQKALLVMSHKKSRIVTYDTMDEDEATLGVGLGCNGVIQVLIEPIDPHLLQHLKEDAAVSFSQQKSSFRNYVSGNENLTAFIEYIPPVISVVIIGAGNDVFPLVDMAEILGWETRVVDGRASYASKDRFAKSCQVLVSKPEYVLEQIPVDQYTVFLLMTHNYNYDLAMLRALLPKKLMYVGVLGPRKKLDRMLNDLKNEGIHPTETQLSFIYGPVGLDIGAETAEEIALSIIAEIKAVYSGRNGQSLRLSEDVIHSREDTRILERKIQ